jgi:hypothetical protein
LGLANKRWWKLINDCWWEAKTQDTVHPISYIQSKWRDAVACTRPYFIQIAV